MRKHSVFLVVAALFAAFTLISPNLQAQPLVTIETVTVGDAGNAADTTGYGAVTNVFAIGKYEATLSQYSIFLNAVAATPDSQYITDLWSPSMTNDTRVAGIARSGAGTIAEPHFYSVTGPIGLAPSGASSPGNRPVTWISWLDAARFANWINNGATNGASTEVGAYSLNGATTGAFSRNPNAQWWIPSQDEWIKSAYYKAGGTNAGYWLYPTQSDLAPGNTIGDQLNQANHKRFDGTEFVYSVTQAGESSDQNYLTDVGAFSASDSAYGTFDQGGNAWEFNDSVFDEFFGIRGGSFDNNNSLMWLTDIQRSVASEYETVGLGFRLATVPEPSTYALLAITAAGALWWARRRR
jgi:sulfatase modifying factor 1